MTAPITTPRQTFCAALACDCALDLDIRQAVPADGQARAEAAEALRRAGLLPRAADRLLDSPAGAQMARTAAERVRTGDHWRHALVHAAGRAVAAVRRAEGARA